MGDGQRAYVVPAASAAAVTLSRQPQQKAWPQLVSTAAWNQSRQIGQLSSCCRGSVSADMPRVMLGADSSARHQFM